MRMAARKPSALTVVFLLFWGGGFAAGGVLALHSAYRSVRLATAGVATTCRVLASRIDVDSDDDGTEYSTRVTYAFEVGGSERVSESTLGGDHAAERDARAIAEQHPPGNVLPCWYDPSDLTNTTLERPSSVFEPLGVGLLGAIFVAIPLLVVPWQLGLLGRWREARRAARKARTRSADVHSGRELFVGYYRAPADCGQPTSYGPLDELPLPAVRRGPGDTLAVAVDSDPGPQGGLPILLFALFWNGVTFPIFAFFLVNGPLLPAAFLLLFVVAGAFIAWQAIKPFTRRLRKVPTLELAQEPIAPGDRVQVALRQPGPVRLDGIQVDFICQERVTYTEGTNTRTETRTLHEARVFTDSYVRVAARERWCPTFELMVPAQLPGSLATPHNFIEHQLRLRASIPSFPDLNETYTLIVLPALEERP